MSIALTLLLVVHRRDARFEIMGEVPKYVVPRIIL